VGLSGKEIVADPLDVILLVQRSSRSGKPNAPNRRGDRKLQDIQLQQN
jgi:hypothetical protein